MHSRRLAESCHVQRFISYHGGVTEIDAVVADQRSEWQLAISAGLPKRLAVGSDRELGPDSSPDHGRCHVGWPASAPGHIEDTEWTGCESAH